jgi:Bacteriophage related domain of unknown function
MTPAAARAAVETALAAAWTDTPIAWPNVPFTPPDTGHWLKVDWLWGNTSRWTKDGVASIAGVLQLALYGARGAGDGALDTAAEAVRAIFNQVRMASPNADVVFGAVSGPVKLTEESWRTIVVSAPFQVHERI